MPAHEYQTRCSKQMIRVKEKSVVKDREANAPALALAAVLAPQYTLAPWTVALLTSRALPRYQGNMLIRVGREKHSAGDPAENRSLSAQLSAKKRRVRRDHLVPLLKGLHFLNRLPAGS
jgi:hypothetical protein